jgi:Putative Ig domain/SMP-30/Gluconolactonase/LRE-like region/IPT/TIG domain
VGIRVGRWGRVWLGVLFCLPLCAAAPGAAVAETRYVASGGTDFGPCTQTQPCASIFRAEAVSSPGDTIDVGPGTFTEHVPILAMFSPLTIRGAGAAATAVTGAGTQSGSVFTIQPGASATIEDLAITGGVADNGGGVNDAGSVTLSHDVIAFNAATGTTSLTGIGGGVYTGLPSAVYSTQPRGKLVVADSEIVSNQATNFGGGISIISGLVTRSLVLSNTVTGSSGIGGGIWSEDSSLTNDTIKGNRIVNTAGAAQGQGGGVFEYHGSGDEADLAFDTIAGNTAGSGGGVGGGTIFSIGTIVAGNTGGNCAISNYDTEYSLEDDAAASCGFRGPKNIAGSDPRLGALTDNGGPTNTMTLQPGSPAIGGVPRFSDFGDECAGLTGDVDQRGFPRHVASRGVCDMGAWDSGGSLTGVVVQTSTTAAGTVGLPYRQQLQAVGGTGAGTYTWSVASGSLPAGLSLSASGLLSGTPTSAGKISFTVEATDLATPDAHVATQALSLTVFPAPSPAVWVANGASGADSAIKAFSLNASGDVAPIRNLSGSQTGLNRPDGMAFDSVGNLYVADADTPAVTEYQDGAYGNVAPIRTISGSATGLFAPAGIALDSAGNIYVANDASNKVTVYAASADGNADPIRTLSGASTQLNKPWGLAVDSAGHLWAANFGSNALTEYAAGANGNPSPIATISGANTRLSDPLGLGQDAKGNLLVVNGSPGSVTGYANAPPFGNKAPTFFIGGAAAQFVDPTSVDVDAANRRYVTNEHGVNVFRPGTSKPTAVIASGPTSGISFPDALAVAPPLIIASTKMPTAALDRHYSANVRALLGKAPLHWRLIAGRLPHGLRMTPRGVITGVPLQLGSRHFVVRVRDSSRPTMTATRRITLTVRRTPAITAVFPRSGPVRGGQKLTIVGRYLASGRFTIIALGRLRAMHLVCQSSTRCTAKTPPHTAGKVNVTATVAGLTSAPGRAARYTYRGRK